jgi:TetR/AcrR family transcriptional regulator, mexCD-oprJ operon repressor
MFRNPDLTRAALLDAVGAALVSLGTAATMAEIAAATGVGRATLYRHFASRRLLLEAVACAFRDEVRRGLVGADLSSVPTEEAVGQIIRAVVLAGCRYPPGVAGLSSIRRDLEAVVTRGVATGAIRTDVPIDVLARVLDALARATIELTADQGGAIDCTAAKAVEVYLGGVRA